MELPAHDGGTGGKFRPKPLRRPSPYDRPLSASRLTRGSTSAVDNSAGWLSKIVDPASRFIAGSASRIFSSVFRKRLAGLPEAEDPEQNCQVRPCVSEPADVPRSEFQVQEAVDDHNPLKNFEAHEISEIEQLLKQNKYTRAQVDYLTGLICSRAVEPTGQESENYNKNAHVSDKGIGVRNSSLNRNLSTSESPLNYIFVGELQNPQDVAASPAEVAKAFMSSGLPKASSSAIGLRSHGFRGDKSSPFSGPSAPKPYDPSVMPRSVLRFSERQELSGASYPSPKPHGRSSIYRMSRSPYFKVDPAVNVMVNKYTTAASTSSQGPSGGTSIFDGRQALKRGRSILDCESGSFGPIRRIRQKSGLISTANACFGSSSSSRGFPLLQSDKEDLKDPSSSQHPSLNEPKYARSGLQIDENREKKIFSSNVPPAPGQSVETSRKILEQLDKFTPREKKSNMKLITRDESPTKLTADMLNEQALRSMENVDTSQFVNMDVIGTSDFRNSEFLGSQSEKFGKAQENCPSNVDVLGFRSAIDSRPGISSADITKAIPATLLPQRKPAFQMTAPEDLLELDDEQDAVEFSVQSTVNMVKTESKIAETKASTSVMSAQKQPLLPSSKRMSTSSSIPLTQIDKVYDVHDSDKDSSFRFSVATNSSGLSSPPLTPTIPSQLHDKMLTQRDQKAVPAFMFGSRNFSAANPSSITDVANESLIESKLDQSPNRKVQLEGSNQFSGSKHEAGLHKSSGIIALPGISTLGGTETIAFGASTTSTQSNGSVHSSSLSSSFAASTSDAIPLSPVSLFSSNRNLFAASSSCPPISSTLPAFSSAITFNCGAASATAPGSVSPLSDKSNFVDTEGKVSNKSQLKSFNLSSAQVESSFLSTGSSNTSLMGSSPLPGSVGTPSVGAIPASSMSMTTNSTAVMPYIFSGVSSSGSGFASSPSFTTKTSGVFDFSSSAQTNSTSVSSANDSSQKSAGESLFGFQPAQSGSSNNSLLSQSLTSQPGSFSSSATLGLSSSSSSVFGTSSSSAFGSNSSSSPGFGQVPFGTTNQSAKHFGSISGFSFASGTGVSTTSSALFSSVSSASNSTPVFPFSTGSNTSNSVFSFSASATSSSPAGNPFSPVAISGLFGNSSPGLSSSMPSPMFGSSPSTGLSFGLKSTVPGVSSVGFGSSSGPAFSFTSSSTTMSAATATPAFEMRSTHGSFSSPLQNNDQMSVEDTMADDTSQAPVYTATFGQPISSQYFGFGSAGPSSGTPRPFQFNSQQNPSTLPIPNPFQAVGNPEFVASGSFSLGSGGGDKSSRKIVKVRRDKSRRK